MTARIMALFGRNVRWHLFLLHVWQLLLAVFWLNGWTP